MKKRIQYLFSVMILSLLITACQGDGSQAEGAETGDINEKTSETHDHHGHDHSHDGHSHDHSSTEEGSTYNRKSPPKEQQSSAQLEKNNHLEATQQLEEGKGAVSADQWAQKKAAAERGNEQPSIRQIGTKSAKTNLPSTCNLISTKKLGSIVGADPQFITIKDGSGRSNPHSQSCFFRWEHRGVPNSGVMIQVQDNPLPDEFPEWAKYYIQAKINQGEQLPDGSGSYKYKKFEGVGDEGAYNFELNRYIWRVGSEYVFMVAFNLYADEETQLEWARKIGNEVMRNF